MADPLNGKSEGWPAPGPEAIVYLAGKGIRCVATDGPTLGGASPNRSSRIRFGWYFPAAVLRRVQAGLGLG